MEGLMKQQRTVTRTCRDCGKDFTTNGSERSCNSCTRKKFQ